MRDEHGLRALFRRAVENALPWYDREAEAIHDARTEDIRQRSIAARLAAEEVRDAYTKAGARQVRR